MDRTLHVVGVAGSLRRGSYNRMLLHAASDLMPSGSALEIAKIGDLPLYNQDVEDAGAPAAVEELRDKLRAADALLFAVPEYNYGVSGVLKNAIDWASRPVASSGLRGKPTAIMGASQGAFGTVRAQLQFRQMATLFDMPLVNRPEILVRNPSEKFDESGRLVDEATRDLLGDLLQALVELTRVLGHGREPVRV